MRSFDQRKLKLGLEGQAKKGRPTQGEYQRRDLLAPSTPTTKLARSFSVVAGLAAAAAVCLRLLAVLPAAAAKLGFYPIL